MKSTNLLYLRTITLQELDQADEVLKDFCKMFVELYGKQHCTINMHLHGHLKECILDFGLVYSFWLFSFERLNGILGSYHTNCHQISLQLMRRFVCNDYYNFHNWPNEYRDRFSPLLCNVTYQKGSLLSSTLEECLANQEFINPLPPIYEIAWELHQKQSISSSLAPLIGHNNYVVLTLYKKATTLSVGGFILGSTKSRFVTTSPVMALHPNHPALPKLSILLMWRLEIIQRLLLSVSGQRVYNFLMNISTGRGLKGLQRCGQKPHTLMSSTFPFII